MTNVTQLLNTTQPYVLISLALILAVVIVIVAIRGKFRMKIGNRTFDIGYDNKHGRSCGDCVLIMMAESRKVNQQIEKLENTILRSQMVYLEQSLPEINEYVLKKVLSYPMDKTLYNKLVHEAINSTAIIIKDEFRRSFKENGFVDINGIEFEEYIRNRIRTIKEILCRYLRIIYSDQTFVGPLCDAVRQGDTDFNGYMYEIYNYARATKREIEGDITKAEKDFQKWLDNFIKTN